MQRKTLASLNVACAQTCHIIIILNFCELEEDKNALYFRVFYWAVIMNISYQVYFKYLS